MSNDEFAALGLRIRELEWNVRRLLANEGMAWEQPVATDGIPPEVMERVGAGDKIGAIKRYREITGVGLSEAKAVLDPLI